MLNNAVSIFVALALGVLGNLLTDPIKSYIYKRSLVNKRKRIDQLTADLKKATELSADISRLYLESLREIIAGMFMFTIGITLIVAGVASYIYSEPIIAFFGTLFGTGKLSFSFIFTIIGGICAYAGYFCIGASTRIFLDQAKIINRVLEYPEYKEEVEERIKQLTPEN